MTISQQLKKKSLLPSSSNKFFRFIRLSKKLKEHNHFNKFSKLNHKHLNHCFEYTWDLNPFLFQYNKQVNLPNTHVFELDLLKKSINFYKILKLISIVIGKKKKILFLSTQEKYKNLVDRTASSSGELSYTSKWIGGYLTNFEQIQMSSLLKSKNHSKKNQLPSLIISVDSKNSEMALHEAFLLNIPVISLGDIYPINVTINSLISGNPGYLPYVYSILNWIVKIINKKKGVN